MLCSNLQYILSHHVIPEAENLFECFGIPRPVVVQPATPPVLNNSRPAKRAKNAHEPRAFAHARWMATFSLLAFAYASVHVIAMQPWVLRASSWPGHETNGPDCWPWVSWPITLASLGLIIRLSIRARLSTTLECPGSPCSCSRPYCMMRRFTLLLVIA
jgi:hypothetical protein